MVSPTIWEGETAERMRSFCEVVSVCDPRAKVEIKEARDWKPEAGYAAMQSLLADHAGFTSVFVAGDALAIGAMRSIADAGLSVPGDISVVSVDDIDLASYLTPSLTTVKMFINDMAATAVQMLLDMIEGRPLTEMQVVIQPQLVVRQSATFPHRI
jgi:LacI family transcriptional regulator